MASTIKRLSVPMLFAIAMLPLAYALNIWQDEAYTLRTTSGGLLDALRRSVVFEAQAPLYSLLLDVWRSLGHSVFVGRLFSIGCAAGAVYVIWGIARTWTPRAPATWVALMLAANPFTVWAALEMRLYALAILLSALLLATFLDGFLVPAPRRRSQIAFAVVAVAAMYTQYYLGVLVAAFAIVLVFRRSGGTAVRSFAYAAVAIVACLIPLFTWLPRQMGSVRDVDPNFGVVRAVSVALESIDLVFSHGWAGSWTQASVANLCYLLVVVALLVLGWLRFRRDANGEAQPLLAMLGIVLAASLLLFFLAVVVAHQSVVEPRHMVGLLVPAVLCAFAFFRPARGNAGLFAAFLAVYFVFSGLSIARLYPGLTKTGDWRHVAAFIDANAQPSDQVAFFDLELAEPFRFYSRAANRYVPIPRAQNFDTPFDQRAFSVHDDGEVRSALEPALASGARVWLVTADERTKVAASRGRAYVEDVVRDDFTTVTTRHFNGTTVRLLEPRHRVTS